MLGEPYFDLCLKQSKQAFTILNCWFARDVTVAMSVVKKHFFLWELQLYFHVNCSRKITPNMASLSRGCKLRIIILAG